MYYRSNYASQSNVSHWRYARLVRLLRSMPFCQILCATRYPMNKSYFNTIQKLQLDKSHIKVPMMLVEECLHGVGSFKQSIFPQNIAMAASFDTDIVYRVGRAIGTEARSIGVHGCFSPVLDLAQDPRWGRVQGE